MTEIINARGVYTPLGASRSTEVVAEAVAEALRNFSDIDALLEQISLEVARSFNVEAATITHCTAASITLSVAAAICLGRPELVQRLPDTPSSQVVLLQEPHIVDYGQSITQAVRLSGARVRVLGSATGCSSRELEEACCEEDVVALLLVDSRLCGPNAIPHDEAVTIARQNDIPTILDGAAQDLRMNDLVEYNADLTLVSVQKYLGGPTAGLVMGRLDLVDCVKMQSVGIGRGMKATKEGILGSLAALRQRQASQLDDWAEDQRAKIEKFVGLTSKSEHIATSIIPDDRGSPFSRVQISFTCSSNSLVAENIVSDLRSGTPRIFVFDDAVARNEISLELVPLTEREINVLASRLIEATENAVGEIQCS